MRTRVLGLAAGGLVLAGVAHSDAPPDPRAAAADSALTPVAYLYGGQQAVTRQELGEFLMARGGADKLDLLINRTIIERAAAKRNLSVTDAEMVKALEDDLAGFGFSKDQFIKVALGKFNKTFYEWMEDVIRPRLLLAKMCKDRVTVTDEAVKVQFERMYGEKRRVQLIVWPKGDDLQAILKIWEKIRTSQTEFDSAARNQPNAALASACGHGKPISRYMPAEERTIEEIAFQLKPGEVSQILNTQLGYVCVKLHEVIPPQKDVDLAKVTEGLRHQAFEEALSGEIPKFFKELKEQAKPEAIYTGPTAWQQLGGGKAEPAGKILKDAGIEPGKK